MTVEAWIQSPFNSRIWKRFVEQRRRRNSIVLRSVTLQTSIWFPPSDSVRRFLSFSQAQCEMGDRDFQTFICSPVASSLRKPWGRCPGVAWVGFWAARTYPPCPPLSFFTGSTNLNYLANAPTVNAYRVSVACARRERSARRRAPRVDTYSTVGCGDKLGKRTDFSNLLLSILLHSHHLLASQPCPSSSPLRFLHLLPV